MSLFSAAAAGNLELVKYHLALGADPKANNSEALIWAAHSGHTEVVRLLVPVSDPKANCSRALRWAACNGHAEVVRLLIPVSDPKANDSDALKWAAYKGHTEVMKLLIPVSDLGVVAELRGRN